MPYCRLETNITVTEPMKEKFSKLATLLEKAIGKPEGTIMFNIVDQSFMFFVNSRTPVAYLSFSSIDLSKDSIDDLSKLICEFLESVCQIKPDRVYIDFNSVRAEFWGWNGKSFPKDVFE